MPASAEAVPVTGWGCGRCPTPKPAEWCKGCAREKGTAAEPNHFVDARVTQPADIIIVAEAPVIPRIHDPQRIHIPFSDDAGVIVTKAISELQKANQTFTNLKIVKTYSVLCTGQDPNKDTLNRCRQFLQGGIQTASTGKLPTIVAMGMSAVKALGIKAKKLKDVQHRVLQGVQIGDHLYNVIVTFSTKQLISMAGVYNTFFIDMNRAMEIASAGSVPQTPLAELTKDYVIPMTIPEVREICERIANYTENGKPPDQWSISVDTETNTKFPHRDTLKLLCVSFAWATGKATAIPLWHPETPYDPELAAPYVRMVLESMKPKSFHNFKFDKKVFMKKGWTVNRFAWDTMLGEHGLEEDKKGLYGLKDLTRIHHPEFATYADVLHELLTKEEGGSQLDNIRKAQKLEAEKAADELVEAPKKKLTKKQQKQLDGGFENIPLKDLLLYAAVDTDMTRRISINQMQRIVAEEKSINQKKVLESRDRHRQYPVPNLCKDPMPIKSLIAHTAVPVSKVLAKMEYDGIRVDRVYLEKLQGDLETVILDTQGELHKMANKEGLNLNSSAMIGNLLFSEGFIHPKTQERTYYDPVSFTAKGQAQITEKVMKFLVAKYTCPFATKKLIYSKAYKAKNTFCQNVWDLSTLDGRLHTNYNIHGTSTGRLSSNDENMQNIPKSLGGFSIKKVFTTSDDSLVFVNADAKGAEIRIFAAYTGDVGLIESLNAGMDTHCFFATKIIEAVRLDHDAKEVLASMNLDDDYPLTYEDFNNRDSLKISNPKYGEMLDKFRTAIKRVVFGILYGAGPKKIAETIGISQTQAQSIIDMLFKMFPSIPEYVEKTKWELRTFGYVETYFGRRRRFTVKGAPNFLRSRAERQTGNFKIQSTSSDIVMGRLIAAEPVLERDLGGRLLLTVHDSIGFEIPKKYLTQLPSFIEETLEKGAAKAHPWLPVAFKWDYEIGPSYGELKQYGAYMKGLDIKEIIDDAKEAYTEEEIRVILADAEAA